MSLSSFKPFANQSELSVHKKKKKEEENACAAHRHHHHQVNTRSLTRAKLSGWQEKRKFVRNLRKCQLLLRLTETLGKNTKTISLRALVMSDSFWTVSP